LILLFQIDRHPDGTAKITVPDEPEPPTMEQAFRRRCYLNGVTDQWKVDKLWAAERDRLGKKAGPVKRGGGRRMK
jgi:hypothetical protein